MKKIPLSLLSIFLLTAFLSGCDHDGDEFDKPFEHYKYPLDAGNSWTYEYRVFSGDEEIVVARIPEVTVEVLGHDEFAPGETGIHIITYAEGYDTAHTWYRQESDGLYMQAYRSPIFAIDPKRGNQSLGFPVSSALLDPPFRQLQTDSIYIESQPLLSVPYPFRIGFRWLYRSEEIGPWVIRKEVIGQETAEYLGESSLAMIVEWKSYPSDYVAWDYTITDEISGIGLVRREVQIHDSNAAADTFIHELISCNIH